MGNGEGTQPSRVGTDGGSLYLRLRPTRLRRTRDVRSPRIGCWMDHGWVTAHARVGSNLVDIYSFSYSFRKVQTSPFWSP